MKKIFTLLLALCMVFSLAACGAEKAPQTDAPQTQAPEASENSGSATVTVTDLIGRQVEVTPGS